MSYPTLRMKFVLSANDAGAWGEDPDSDSGAQVLRSTEITLDGRVTPETVALRKLTAREFRATKVRVGDILVVKSSGSNVHLGKSGWVDERSAGMSFSNFIQRLRVSAGFDPRFTWYFMNCNVMKDQVRLLSSTSTGLQNLSGSLIREIEVPSPPLDEQRRIADFLDAETARIDQLVSLRNLQAARLSEALHSEAKRVSGSEWQRLPLRRVVETVQTGTTPTELLRPADPDNLPWYTPAALGGILDLNDADKSIRREDIDQVPRFSAESILIVGIGESLGKVADLDHEATGNQQLTAIRTAASADRRFVAWRLFAAYDEIRAWAQYSRVRILNNEVLKSFTIPVPSIDQQVRVRADLDHRLSDFTEFRNAATRFSQLARERRQALITAAVTGGITV
jgi:type I restriction enzyme, S subunit